MKQRIFSIRDSKAEMFYPPFYQKTHGEAERSLRELVRDEKSLISKYPEDYDLYFLGEWDDQSGKMTLEDTPKHVIKATQLAISEKVAQLPLN